MTLNCFKILLKKEITYDSFQYEKAIEKYKHAIKNSPAKTKDMIALYFNIGYSYIQLKNYVDAEKYLKEALEIDPSNIDTIMNLSFIHIATRNYIKSEEVLSNALNKLSEQKSVYKLSSMLAIVKTQQGKTTEAIHLFEKALQINPNDPETYKNLGSIYYNMKKYELSAKNYEKAFQHNPNDNQTCNILSSIYHKNLNNTNEALKVLKKGFELDFNNFEILTKLVLINVYTLKNYEEGEKYLRLINDMKDAPNKDGSLCLLGQILTLKGNFEEAIVNFDKSLEVLANDKEMPPEHYQKSLLATTFQKAKTLCRLKRFSDAIKILEDLCAIFPAHEADINYQISEIYMENNDYEKALFLYEKYLTSKTPKAVINFMKKCASLLESKYIKDLNEDNIDSIIKLAKIYNWQDKYEDALKFYQMGFEQDPKNFKILIEMAFIYSKLEKYELSDSYAKKAIEVNFSDTMAHMLLGTNLFVQGKFNEAKSYFKNILGLNPNGSSLESTKKFIELCDEKLNNY